MPEATVGLSGAASSPVITASVGGRELASAASLVARIAGMAAGIESHLANMAALSGGWQRRWDDWQFQAGQASLEMAQIHAQILAAQTRHQQAQQELDEYDERIADAQQVDDFLRTKYTNAELYGWMVSQMASLYSQSYQLALDAARRAEAAFRYELAPDPSTFIQPSYWNSLRSGLLAGEQLAHDLQQMEAAFLDRNIRQFETTKNVSLALAAPDALIAAAGDRAVHPEDSRGVVRPGLPRALPAPDQAGRDFAPVRHRSLHRRARHLVPAVGQHPD